LHAGLLEIGWARFLEAYDRELGGEDQGGIAELSPRSEFFSEEAMSLTKVAIAGVSSEVGKTTLLCDLLREFSGWEAIKMTRGHYRSCGKDPHACCVSHLLGDEPIVRSGFQQTYASDKDTGRYWDAGATNVHWVIVTNEQVERGIQLALERVHAPGVLIEGNSFLRFVDVDFVVLVTGGTNTKIKSSARWAFQKASVVYLFDQTLDRTEATSPKESLELLNRKFGPVGLNRSLPAYATGDFPRLVERITKLHSITAPVRLESGLVRPPGAHDRQFVWGQPSPGGDVSIHRSVQGERS
jgi:hypothetical protein